MKRDELAKGKLAGAQDILSILSGLEGIIFAALGSAGGMASAAGCTCENCGCYTRNGDDCGCFPRCSCQDRTDLRPDSMMNALLGVASILPMDDVATLVELRDKVTELVRRLPE